MAKKKITEEKGETWLVSADNAEQYTEPVIDADLIRKYRRNIYLRKFLEQQHSLLFGEQYTIDVFDPEGEPDTELAKHIKVMLDAKGVRLWHNMQRAYPDIAFYGIAVFNPVWEQVGTEWQLKKLKPLPAYTFRTGSTYEGTCYVFSDILPGIIQTDKGEIKYYQEQADGTLDELTNVSVVRNPTDDSYVGDPLYSPLYPILNLMNFSWKAQMQWVNRWGAGGNLLIKVTNATGDDIDYAQDLLRNYGKNTGWTLRDNMEPIMLGDANNAATALDTIGVLHKLMISYFSPADMLRNTNGNQLGGSTKSEMELLINYVRRQHDILTTGFEDMIDEYFPANGYEEGWHVKIYIPTISIEKAEIWLQQALAGDKMGVLLDNEKRDLLERDELDDEGLAQLAAERSTRPVQPEQVNEMQGIAALMAATPLNPEKGIKTYRKYKTKQISLSNEE